MASQYNKINKLASGAVILQDAADNILANIPAGSYLEPHKVGQPDEGVRIMNSGRQLFVLNASTIKRTQINPDPEQTGLNLTAQTLATILVDFFFS